MIMMGETICQIWVNLPTLSILGLSCRPATSAEIYEPVREKTNNLGSDHVRHKPGCTVTEDGLRLEMLDLESRGIALSV